MAATRMIQRDQHEQAQCTCWVNHLHIALSEGKEVHHTYTIFENETPIGSVNVCHHYQGIREVSLRIEEPFRKQGYGTEAIREITDKLFREDVYTRRLHAIVRHDDIAFRKALWKAGWVKEGYLREVSDGANGGAHRVVYSATRSDWQEGVQQPIVDPYYF
ncbi:MAG: GNAT family N-acetyltransferase [Bacilli bacterium]